jgi:hypothetical protein
VPSSSIHVPLYVKSSLWVGPINTVSLTSKTSDRSVTSEAVSMSRISLASLMMRASLLILVISLNWLRVILIAVLFGLVCCLVWVEAIVISRSAYISELNPKSNSIYLIELNY